MRPTILLLACALTVSAQQQPAHTEPTVYVTAIDVVVDVRDASGNLPTGLTPDDFVLTEEGVERKIIGVDYLRAERTAAAPADPSASTAAPAGARKPWQTVLYFETELSSSNGRKQTAKELIKHADRLVQMGTVDVIFANPRPVALVQSSRDPNAVRAALETVAKSVGGNQIAMQRNEFRTYVQSMTQTAAATEDVEIFELNDKDKMVRVKKNSRPSTSAMSPAVSAVNVKLVRPYIEQEIQLVNQFRSKLTTWLSNYSRYAPRTLILATDGFDLDPLEYYSANLNKGDEMELKSYVTQASLAAASEKMARSLATAGWVTLSVQGNTYTDGWIDDASSNSNVGRIKKDAHSSPQMGPRALLIRPIDPLMHMADETGGDVAVNSGKIAKAIEKIDDRLRITYQVDRKPDGKARPIALRARDTKLKVRTPRWAASSTSDEMAEERALARLHEAGGYAGDLSVDASVNWTTNSARKQGTLSVVSKLPGPAAKTGDFRFTLAVLVPPRDAFVKNHPLTGFTLLDGAFNLKTPLDLPPATSVVVIAIEDLSTGLWGSSRIEVK